LNWHLEGDRNTKFFHRVLWRLFNSTEALWFSLRIWGYLLANVSLNMEASRYEFIGPPEMQSHSKTHHQKISRSKIYTTTPKKSPDRKANEDFD
jgi:hypothetical protein